MFFFTNLFLTTSNIWSLTYFILIFYLVLIFSSIIYLVSNIKEFTNYNSFSNLTFFNIIPGLDLILFVLTPVLIINTLTYSWVSSDLLTWFGHLVLTSLQLKTTYYISFFFLIIWLVYLISFYYTSQEIYDYTIVLYSFFLWVFFLFYVNNILTFIFFIEILSTLIMLMIITSVFSSAYFYNNLNLNHHSYFNQTLPTSFLQTIMFFFWISLVSSLTLFVFLTLFYLYFYTFDWFSLEIVFFYVISVSNIKTTFSILLVWSTFIFCIFLKCGLVPFYFWKPIFFKGIPLHSLFFYVVFFYFFLFSFFIYFFLIYLNEIFYFNILVNISLLILGLFLLIFIICESFYIKAFLAMSSILNTLLVFLALNSYSIVDYIFFL